MQGRIHDFQAANELWASTHLACSTLGEPLAHSCFCPTAEICQEEVKDWDFVEENFRPIFKAYDSQFKLMRYHHVHLLARPLLHGLTAVPYRSFNDFYSKDDLQSSTWLALRMHPSTNTTKAEVLPRRRLQWGY